MPIYERSKQILSERENKIETLRKAMAEIDMENDPDAVQPSFKPDTHVS